MENNKSIGKETTKNLTISLLMSDHTDLEALVDYFQSHSISSVSKSDVIRYLIRRYSLLIENGHVDKIKEIIKEELELK